MDTLASHRFVEAHPHPHDSRRKQKWVDPLLTPPRSPTLAESDPTVIQDILDLWAGSGLEDYSGPSDVNDINAALTEFAEYGFQDDVDLLNYTSSIPFIPGDSTAYGEENAEDLLEKLFEFVANDSPPPTNPPSPPECDYEAESTSVSFSETTEKLFDQLLCDDPNPPPSEDLKCAIRIAGPKSTIFTDETIDMKIKHDCMWPGDSLNDGRFDDFISEFDHPNGIKLEHEEVEEEEMAWEETFVWSEESSPSTDEESASKISPEEQLDHREEDFKNIQKFCLMDHSYALPHDAIGTPKQDALFHHNMSEAENDFYSCDSDNTDLAEVSVNGVIVQDERNAVNGVRKRKILVPLKQLMESLNRKQYLVSPLCPGKKIVKLTRHDSVKRMLGLNNNEIMSIDTIKSLPRPCLPLRSCADSQSLSTSRRKQKAKAKESSPPPNEPTPSRPKKTKTHNNMERMRRVDLRNSFDSLKNLVPHLSKSAKSSKVEILRRTEEYINGLKALEKRFLREEALQRSRNDALKLQLIHLQCD